MKIAVPILTRKFNGPCNNKNGIMANKLSALLRGDRSIVKPFSANLNGDIKFNGKVIEINQINFVEYNGNNVDIIPFLFNMMVNFSIKKGDILQGADKHTGLEYLAERVKEVTKVKNLDEAVIYINAHKKEFEKLINSKYPILNTICSFSPCYENYEVEVYLSILLLHNKESIILEYSLNNMFILADSIWGDIGELGGLDDKKREEYLKKVREDLENKLDIGRVLKTDMTSIITVVLSYKWYNDLVDKLELKLVKLKEDYSDLMTLAFKERGSYFKKWLEGKISTLDVIKHRIKYRKYDDSCELSREIDAIAFQCSLRLTKIKNEAEILKITNAIDFGIVTSNIGLNYKPSDIYLFAFGKDRIYRLLSSHVRATKSPEMFISIIKDRIELESIRKENISYREEAKTSERKARSLDKKVSKLSTEIDRKTKEVNRLKNEKTPKDRLNKLNKEVQTMHEENIKLRHEIEDKNNTIAEKSRQYSDMVKLNKKLEYKIRKIEELFGTIEIFDEECNNTDIEICNKSIETKVEELNNFKILFCGGTVGMPTYLDKIGLRNYEVIKDLGEAKKRKEFDILIVCSDFVSHKLVYTMSEQAEKQKAIRLYYTGTNIKNMINIIYEYVLGNKK